MSRAGCRSPIDPVVVKGLKGTSPIPIWRCGSEFKGCARFGLGSIYQGAILVYVFEPQPYGQIASIRGQ